MSLNFEHVSSFKIEVHTRPKISLIKLIVFGKINMQNLDWFKSAESRGSKKDMDSPDFCPLDSLKL